MPDVDESLGKTLRKRRREIGYGVQAAARSAGIDKRSVLDWEADRFRPSGPALDRLLTVLRVSERERAELLVRGAPDYARGALASTVLGAPVGAGEVLRAIRIRRGETQAQVARRLDVAQGTLARWENDGRTPDPELVERLLTTLQATIEERDAFAAVPWTTPDGESLQSVEARIRAVAHALPLLLRNVALLGLEAELWRKAARDREVDPLLTRTIATRAQQSLLRGDLGDIEGLRRRALRLAALTRRPDPAVAAVYAACWVGQRRPGGALPAARTLARWAGNLDDPELRTWLLSAHAIAVSRTEEAESGIALLEDLDRQAADRSWADVLYHRLDLAEGLLLAGQAERASEIVSTLGDSAPALIRAKVSLATGNIPTNRTLVEVDALAAQDWVKARDAKQVRCGLQAILKGRRPRFD